MAKETGRRFFVYHMYGDTMVMDEADGLAQLRAHYEGDPKFENDIVAAVFKPLTDRELKAYMDQYKITYDPTKRPELKPYDMPKTERPLRGASSLTK